MTAGQLELREAALQSAGYHKSRATSSTNDYSWFKTIKDPTDPEEWLYMIEWRVWDWSKYIDNNHLAFPDPYSMQPCILVNLPDASSAKMVYPDLLSIEDAERLAKDFYDLINENRKQCSETTDVSTHVTPRSVSPTKTTKTIINQQTDDTK